MARALSDPEWSAFVSQVNVSALNLPPWGGVVEWNGLQVLVFIGADGNVWTTDVSNDDTAQEVLASMPRSYDPNQSVWYYQVPQQAMQQIVSVAQTAGQIAQKTVSAVTEAAGQAAGNILAPTLSNLSGPIVIALVILGIYFLGPRR